MLCPELLYVRSFYRTNFQSASIFSGRFGHDAYPSRGEPYPSRSVCCCRNAPRRNNLEENRKILLARRTCDDSRHTWSYTYRRSALTPWRLSGKRIRWIHRQFCATGNNPDSFSHCD